MSEFRFSPLTNRRRRLNTLLLTIVLFPMVLLSCGGDNTALSDEQTTTTSPAELQVKVFTDPAKPVTAKVGQRFAVMLPADPGAGWKWTVTGIDPRVLLPLGLEFNDDASLEANANPSATSTTTTTVAPRPATNGQNRATTTTTTVAPAPTTSVQNLSLVQINSFAGRIAAVTQLVFEGRTISGAPNGYRVTFNVEIS